jgi:hypothetical protein
VMRIRDTNLSETGESFPAEVLNVAGKVFAALLLASKNLSLYPQGHSISINSIKQFHTKLEAYHQKYGYLRFEIERNRVVCQDKEISSCPTDEGTLPFTLFRDGIRWLEFTEGITPEEITNFITIVKQYSILSAEPEGDIVTTIWEAQFPHIQYEVADFLIGSEDGMKCSISAFKAAATATRSREKNLDEQKIIRDHQIDPALLLLSSHEQAQLYEMIRCEEVADFLSYVNVLLDSLLLYRDEESFCAILDVLEEEFTGSLARGEFEVTMEIFRGLHRLFKNDREQMPWTGTAVEKFFLNISGVKSLSPVVAIWKDINTEQINIIEKVFQSLHPQAIHTLAILLQQNQSDRHRKVLTDSIIALAAEDMSPLESLLNHPDEKLAENLIPIFLNLDGQRSLKCLMKLTRHVSPIVREKAIGAITHRRLIPLSEMFNLVDDSEETIRQLMLKQMGKRRDNAVEELFLTYLKNGKFSKNRADHVVECFRALGRCGSSRSVPYLRETLFRRNWMLSFWRSVYRKGAAIALETMKIPEAERVLEEARRSLYPGLRRIFKKANSELPKKRGGR